MGEFFVGSMYSDDRAFVQAAIQAARRSGYERFVEPCSGQLACTCYATDAGFGLREASDVTLFSGILGRYAEGRGIEDMQIVRKATGERLEDPVEALYEVKRLMLQGMAGSEYGLRMLRYYERRREDEIEAIRAMADAVRERAAGVRYRDMDMFAHLAEAYDDPKAFCVVNMLSYKGGYEASYKAVDAALSWNEPSYELFDPNGGYQKFMDYIADAKCLVISYQEAEPGHAPGGDPVYGRRAGRAGANSYIVSNRPEEVEAMLGRSCSVQKPAKMEPFKGHPIIPQDYEIGRKSRLTVSKAKPEQVRYYRKLLTRNFAPSQLSSGYLMLVDGYVAGVFGYLTLTNSLDNQCDSAFIGYAIAASGAFRISKLLHMVACQRRVLRMELDDVQMTSVRKVKTAMLSKFPSCSELRGVMKLDSREEGGAVGYKLVYSASLQDKTMKQVLCEFIDKEERCKRESK